MQVATNMPIWSHSSYCYRSDQLGLGTAEASESAEEHDRNIEAITAILEHQQSWKPWIELNLLAQSIDVRLECVGGHGCVMAPQFVQKDVAVHKAGL